jgi:hypothetical protein
LAVLHTIPAAESPDAKNGDGRTQQFFARLPPCRVGLELMWSALEWVAGETRRWAGTRPSGTRRAKEFLFNGAYARFAGWAFFPTPTPGSRRGATVYHPLRGFCPSSPGSRRPLAGKAFLRRGAETLST